MYPVAPESRVTVLGFFPHDLEETMKKDLRSSNHR